MNTKKLMTKVTLGAAMILTTAAVATTVVVPNVVRADDTAVVDKNKEVFTVYGPLGTEKMSYNNLYDENGVVYQDFAKLRDFEYTRVNTEGVWFVGPNGEQNYDPNSATTEPTTPSTTTPTTPSTTEPTTPSTTDNTQTSESSVTTESSEASSTEGTGTSGTTSSTTEASQTSVADKGQASTTGAKQDNTTTSSQETKTETSNSPAPVATTTAVNGSKTASSAMPDKTNQLPVTGESNLISTIMGITGLTLLLSWFGFKAYRESK